MEPMLLALDMGTSHTKAGLFSTDGNLVQVARRAVSTCHHRTGYAYFDPDETWGAAIQTIKEVTRDFHIAEIACVGIASMAETGLLINNQTGEPRTPLIPWFDTAATSHVETLINAAQPLERFCRSGIHPNFKSSLAKLLWLRKENATMIPGTTWLSMADFIAHRLSGKMATDYSLGGRTYAFRIDRNTWDEEWLDNLGFNVDLFPPALPSGQPVGEVTRAAGCETGLVPGTPVSICGHDHVCAAFAIAGLDSSKILDSMGTAEALVGSFPKQRLGEGEFQSGLVFGRHVAGDGFYWMGGMSASGASLEWLRNVLGNSALKYQDIERVLEQSPPGPSGIIYFPYLSGSGSPHTDILVRAAFMGLTLNHTQADLIKSVLEGTGFEAEFIRQAAQQILAKQISTISASGGGTSLQRWMQIKADISGCRIEVRDVQEATLLGAALVSGIGSGIYPDAGASISALQNFPMKTYLPDDVQKHAYQAIYQQGFLPLQAPLRRISRKISAQ